MVVSVAETASGDLEAVLLGAFLAGVFDGVGVFLPRAPGVALPRIEGFGVGVTLGGGAAVDFEGGDATGVRARDSEAAVGLLSRSDAPTDIVLLEGVGAGDGAFRARARDAAVGAYRFDDRELGVMGVRDGVFGRAGVDGVTLEVGFLVVALDVAGLLMVWGLRVPGGGDKVDDAGGLEGVLPVLLGVLVVGLGAVEGGERVEVAGGFDGVRVFDGTGFDGGVGLVSGSGCTGAGAGAGSGGFCGASAFGGSEEPFVAGSTGAGDSVVVGAGSGCATGDLKRKEVGGGADGVEAASVTDLGGHSRFSLSSSFAESPVVCETTLELLGGV